MPIRVTCQCGNSLNVPDALAGKSGKCPKCKQVIRIPAGPAVVGNAPAPVAANAQGPAKTSKPALASQDFASSGLGGLFDAAGLVQKQGNFCPSCDANLAPGAVICVKCGLNLAEGTRVEGHKLETKKGFGNKRLNEAVDSMSREAATEKRLLNSGTPWWLMFAALAGVLVFISGALIWMDAKTTGTVSSNPTMARIQNAAILDVLLASMGFGLYLIAFFAAWGIIFTAFFESAVQGLLTLCVPFYAFYYMFSRMQSKRLGTIIVIFFVCSILSGVCLAISLPRI